MNKLVQASKGEPHSTPKKYASMHYYNVHYTNEKSRPIQVN